MGTRPSIPFTQLAGYLYPTPEIVSSTRIARHWAISSVDSLPDESELSSEIDKIVSTVGDEIRSTFPSAPSLEDLIPLAGVLRIDDHHCVVSIEHASPSASYGDTDVIATWNTLRAFDSRFKVKELQGLPRECWWTLKA